MKRTALTRKTPLERGGPLRRLAPVRKRKPFEPKSGPSTKTLDDLCREVVFARDGYRCVKCGKPCTETWVSGGVTRYNVIQWSHIFTRSIMSIRWDLDNSVAKCGGCHIWWGRNLNGEAHDWHREKYPGVMDALDLRRKANTARGTRIDRGLILIHLKQELRRYTAGQG